ncbi:protein LITTLE ZIPPER 1-like [Phragmites australis]|uniref:protein LITTLE ZIPPER 1-like n=1 Tax=Phragmites australis TaxID=29695 RepID=UPI002D766D6F|nr:protein LITTLE ZIPPER 1-like [Phragmites australis]
MCSGSWNGKKQPFFLVLKQQKKPHVPVSIRRNRLRLRRRAGAETMEMVNLKLYLENRCIIAENERLREKASSLRRENLALRENLSKTAAEAELPEAGAGARAA